MGLLMLIQREVDFFFQNFFVGNSGEDFKFLNLYLNWCVIFISLNNMSTQSLSDLFTVLDIYLFPTTGVQPWQDPGGTLGMNGVGERRHVRPTLIGPSLRMNGEREKKRERERVIRRGCLQSLAGSGNALFFYHSFYTPS